MKNQLVACSLQLVGKFLKLLHFLPATSYQLQARNRGFSVVEMIIVIAVSSVIALAIAQIYLTYNNSYVYQNASINASLSAALFINEISEKARQANAVAASWTYSGTTYTTGSTTVVFSIPSINSSGDILASTYDYAIFFSSTTNVYRILDANVSSARKDETKKLSDVLQNLTFTYDNGTPSSATAVTAEIVNQTKVKQSTTTTRLKQQVYLRNK